MAANRHSTFSLGCKCPIFVKFVKNTEKFNNRYFRPVIYYLMGFVSGIIIVCVALLSGEKYYLRCLLQMCVQIWDCHTKSQTLDRRLFSGMGCTKLYSIQTNSYVDMCPTVGVTVVIEVL